MGTERLAPTRPTRRFPKSAAASAVFVPCSLLGREEPEQSPRGRSSRMRRYFSFQGSLLWAAFKDRNLLSQLPAIGVGGLGQAPEAALQARSPAAPLRKSDCSCPSIPQTGGRANEREHKRQACPPARAPRPVNPAWSCQASPRTSRSAA